MDNVVIVINWADVGMHFKELYTSPIYVGLLILILIDVLTGKSKAVLLNDFDSSIGTRGLIKHTTIIILNTLVGVTVRVFGVMEVGYIFGLFYMLEYVTSILENLDVLGIPFPDSFKKHFRRMREENNSKEV